MDKPPQATDLRVTVIGGRNLAAKTDGKSDPYVEIFILNQKGDAIGKAKKTQVRSPSPSKVTCACFTGGKRRDSVYGCVA